MDNATCRTYPATCPKVLCRRIFGRTAATSDREIAGFDGVAHDTSLIAYNDGAPLILSAKKQPGSEYGSWWRKREPSEIAEHAPARVTRSGGEAAPNRVGPDYAVGGRFPSRDDEAYSRAEDHIGDLARGVVSYIFGVEFAHPSNSEIRKL
jgi:hypothetical protein